MATPNGDVPNQTAESFARDYLENLFNNNKNLGAFEEETLDLNITSKYDDIVVEEEEDQVDNSVASESVAPAEEPLEPGQDTLKVNGHLEEVQVANVPEPAQVAEVAAEVAADEPLEPGKETLQVNGHVEEIEVAARNGHLESEVIEPGHAQFSSQSSEPLITEQLSQLTVQADEPVEPGQTNLEAEYREEETESDHSAPVPMSRGQFQTAKVEEEENEEEGEEELDQIAKELEFKKMGLTKNWWDSKRTETENTKEPGKPVDKFKTIKQNIRRGNTRSLLERFENMSKVAE